MLEFKGISVRDAQAEAEWRLAFSRSMAKAKLMGELTSQGDREAWATVDAGDELYVEKCVASALRAAQRQLIEMYNHHIDIYRSLLVTARGTQDPRR